MRWITLWTTPPTPNAPAFFAADHGAAPGLDGEHEALELARRVAASDVGQETVSRLELAVDGLATRYPTTPPAELLADVRRHLGYVMRLVEARTTLREHHRLLVTAGWLSLLAATHIDVDERAAAAGWLATAASLAQESRIARTRRRSAPIFGQYGATGSRPSAFCRRK